MKPFILFLSLLILYSCIPQQENKKTENTTTQDTLAPLQVTVIAELPDSLQPKVISLDKMPKPLTISAGKGEIKMLAVLQNEKGEPILDPNSQPFILGNGGKSNFTNYTTENGLAYDQVTCLIRDRFGNLWFGSYGGNAGVSKYDGKSFTNFTVAQGLVNNDVSCIMEDKVGNLWFGTTHGGVSCYDGKSFINFTTAQGLSSNVINCITEDNAGNIWFGTFGGGVCSYNTKLAMRQCNKNTCRHNLQDARELNEHNIQIAKSFTNLTTSQGLVNNTVNCIAKDLSGSLWFGTSGGVSRYNPNGTILACNNNTCKHDLSISQDLRLHNREISKSFTNYTKTQGLANNSVFCIAMDKTGTLWFGTWGGGVSCYVENYLPKSPICFRTFTTANGLVNNDVRSIFEDINGNIWFGTNGGGVSRYDGRTFKSFSVNQGLTNNAVFGITEDRAGNIWFGTSGGGISCYTGESFTNFNTDQGLANSNIMGITEDKTGNLWFCVFGKGICKFDGKSFTNISTNQGLINEQVFCITKDKSGKLWFGTARGVSCYDGKSFTSYSESRELALRTVLSIVEDKTGNLWFSTYGNGVCKFDGKTFTNFTSKQGLISNYIYSIMEDKTGNLWFGGNGVSLYDGKSFTNFTSVHGLADENVWSMTEDKTGNLWFCTPKGLCLLEESKVNFISNYKNRGEGKPVTKLINCFGIAEGLPDNLVTQVIQMPNGKMAIGSFKGITLFNLSEDLKKLTNIEIFNSNTGYPVKDLGQNSMYLDSKGIIWAATGSEKTALVRFDYTALHKNSEPPSVVIQSVKIKDENICWYNLQSKGVRKNQKDSATALLQEFFAYGKTLSDSQNGTLLKRFGNIQFDGISKFYPLPQNLMLPYEHNQIAFDFAAIETDRPFLVKYQYMLEGYDNEWGPITAKSNASFGNISEGTYTFKLKAQGANGVWSKPIIYTFKVLPPWYRTWWAYLIYVLSFLAALRIFSKWRERKLLAEKEKLEKTVEVRTAEVLAEKNEADKQRKRSDDLLLNILPEEVAEELKAKGSAEAKQFDEVTVLFTDFKDFTQISETMTAKELVEELNIFFKAFDNIITALNIEKIKTIGDSYMCVGGLPAASPSHAEDVVTAGLEIQKFVEEHSVKRMSAGKEPLQIRIGIHSGPVVAGIVGIKKYAYDIWGDTVNTASRMESSGEAGKVNMSETTYELVKNKFKCTPRGKIMAKHKGEMKMYFVEGRI